MMYTIEDAVLLYILRDERVLDPSGGFDKHGRWWADEETEEQPCCKRHYPSRRRPYRMIKHCRTLGHITDLLEVDYAAANRLLRSPEWRVVRKILQLSGNRIGLQRDARPTLQEYAPLLLRQAHAHAHELTETELATFTDWIRAYCPEVDEINWDAVRAYNMLKQR